MGRATLTFFSKNGGGKKVVAIVRTFGFRRVFFFPVMKLSCEVF